MNTIILQGCPISTNHAYRHHGKFVYMSAEARSLKKDYQWQIMSQWKRKSLEGDIELEIKLYFKDNRRRDWDNWHKLTMDSMNRLVFEDDSQIKKATVEKFIDKSNPRVEINIYEPKES
jgi:Holliday junction resolvase RusA-like endonuclease